MSSRDIPRVSVNEKGGGRPRGRGGGGGELELPGAREEEQY